MTSCGTPAAESLHFLFWERSHCPLIMWSDTFTCTDCSDKKSERSHLSWIRWLHVFRMCFVTFSLPWPRREAHSLDSAPPDLPFLSCFRRTFQLCGLVRVRLFKPVKHSQTFGQLIHAPQRSQTSSLERSSSKKKNKSHLTQRAVTRTSWSQSGIRSTDNLNPLKTHGCLQKRLAPEITFKTEHLLQV